MNKKQISIFELILIVVSVISFSYFVSSDLPDILENPKENKVIQFITKPIIPSVSANPFVASGCCLETKTGAICQEMNLLEAEACASPLIGTSCSTVDQCKKGCCYSGDSGICTLNAPQEKCSEQGGEWNRDANCNIEQCQLGCCVLGDSVAMTTTRECTLLARDYNMEKDFRNLDSQGSCSAYQDLSEEGACLFESDDFSNEKECRFTTKGNCNGEFKQGYLCTSKELNTTCEKTKETSCIDGKDQVYYLDSCGNRANIYDSSRYDDDSYWEKPISASESCGSPGASCGNCQYAAGSVCTAFVKNRDVKPVFGDFVCKDLSCGERKHGESWCVSDYNPSGIAAAPVGSRNYVAKCVESEISIEGCADFNQEICIESKDTSNGFTEARCLINDWRSCISANEKETYEQVKSECELYPQCIMFLDIPGNEKYIGLPGFKDSGTNEDQGRAGDVGEDTNTVLAHCVPRYTPGFQFWNTPSNPFTTSSGATESAQNYGGSQAETNALCTLGSFTCVSHIETDTSIAGGDSTKDKENPECNIDAHDPSKQQVPLLMEALNERCRSIGTCGSQVNVAGQLGYAEGFTVKRTYIDKKGKDKNASSDEYILPEGYLSSLAGKQASNAPGIYSKLADLKSLSAGFSIEYLFLSLLTGRVVGELEAVESQAQADIGQNQADYEQTQMLVAGAGGAVGSLALIGRGELGLATSFIPNSGTTVVTSGTYTWTTAAGQTYTSTATSASPITFTSGTQLGADAAYRVTGGSATFINGVPATTSTGTIPPAGTLGTKFTQQPTSAGASARGALTQLGITLVAMAAGYAIGSLIVKNSGMTPAEANNFMGAMMAGFSAIGAGASIYFLNSVYLIGWGGIGLLIAIGFFIASLFQSSTDHEYYIMEYTCEAWEPPKQGNCDLCNDDVRPCSENKCRSLGNNCHYFNENGEPGYCASLAEIWSAKITPWEEVLTDGNKYTSVQNAGFKIEGANKKEVAAWEPLTFGIITDKQAICKLSSNHSQTFDQMEYVMLSSKNYETGKVDGQHHEITLSPHVSNDEEYGTTPGLEKGENEYYIKCRNFAGQENEAPFIVQIVRSEGPDLTPALIRRFVPEQNSYVKMGSNSSNLFIYLNEPAECRYSIEYDESSYLDMPYNFSCNTNPNAGFYGEWPCFAILKNLSKTNQIFIKCRDQPGLVETDLVSRIISPQSTKYTLNVCQEGLSIATTSPSNGEVIDGDKISDFKITVQTKGCVNGGDAVCSFKMSNSSVSVNFLETGNRTHVQPLNSLSSGNHTLDISCIDPAGNTANQSLSFSIFYDRDFPSISRLYRQNDKLIVQTNENAVCLYQQNNESLRCDFNFNNITQKYSKRHELQLNDKGGIYYLKCADEKQNKPLDCSIVLKLSA